MSGVERVRKARYLVIVLLNLVPVVAALLYVLDVLPWHRAAVAAAAGLAILVPLYGLLSLRDYFRPTPRYTAPVVDSAQLEQLISEIKARRDFSAADARFYLQMVIDPYRYAPRTTDRIIPTTRAFTLSRSQTIAIPRRLAPSDAGADFCGYPLPIDIIHKGALVNQMSVQKHDGQTVSTLTQAATIAHTLLAIDVIIDSVGVETPEACPTYSEIRPRLVALLCRGEAFSSSDEDLRAVVAQILQLDASPGKRRLLATVCGMLHVLASHYPLVIYVRDEDLVPTFELSGSRVARLLTQRRVLPHIGQDESWAQRQLERIRGWLGVPAAELCWVLSAGIRTRSYHVEIMGPPGTYLARQQVQNRLSPGRVPSSRLLGRYGQRFAHLYVCDFRATPVTREQSALSDAGRAEYVATFFERPPGAIGAATLSAWASLALMAIAAAASLSGSLRTSTDLVAILLAVPPLTAGWIGLQQTNASSFRGTAVARLILLMTVLLDVLAGALYVLGGESDLARGVFEQDTSKAWIVLVISMAWLALSGTTSWILRVMTHRHFIKRQPPESRHPSFLEPRPIEA